MVVSALAGLTTSETQDSGSPPLSQTSVTCEVPPSEELDVLETKAVGNTRKNRKKKRGHAQNAKRHLGGFLYAMETEWD